MKTLSQGGSVPLSMAVYDKTNELYNAPWEVEKRKENKLAVDFLNKDKSKLRELHTYSLNDKGQFFIDGKLKAELDWK